MSFRAALPFASVVLLALGCGPDLIAHDGGSGTAEIESSESGVASAWAVDNEHLPVDLAVDLDSDRAYVLTETGIDVFGL